MLDQKIKSESVQRQEIVHIQGLAEQHDALLTLAHGAEKEVEKADKAYKDWLTSLDYPLIEIWDGSQIPTRCGRIQALILIDRHYEPEKADLLKNEQFNQNALDALEKAYMEAIANVNEFFKLIENSGLLTAYKEAEEQLAAAYEKVEDLEEQICSAPVSGWEALQTKLTIVRAVCGIESLSEVKLLNLLKSAVQSS